MGFFSWIARFREARRRILDEDALKHLHACEWQGGYATTDSVAGALGLSLRSAVRLIERLQAQGSVESVRGGLRLTARGERLAIQVIRAHRLWERYLADEARMPMQRLHSEADRREHRRPPGGLKALDASMGFPEVDPHGDPIPGSDGAMVREDYEAHPLTDWPVDEVARIVHLEDEPASVFSQLLAAGLRVGQRIRVLESDRERIVFADDADTYVLAPLIAANVFVGAVEPAGALKTDEFVAGGRVIQLCALARGACGTVVRLDERLQGFTRRRLLDMGMTPGAKVCAEYESAGGNPVAYRVRGALIALRRDQAERVWIERAD